MEARIVEVTHAIARELGIRGLINIQFVIHDGALYILEANPRASRTVPIISKATGINLVAAATRIALGERLRDMPWGIGLRPRPAYTVVKVPVFSFAKMRGVETILGPGDEVDRRGARASTRPTPARCSRGSSARGSGCRARAAACSSRSPMRRRRNVDCCGVRRARAYARRDWGTTIRWRHGIPAETINAIAEGSPHVLDAIARAASIW